MPISALSLDKTHSQPLASSTGRRSFAARFDRTLALAFLMAPTATLLPATAQAIAANSIPTLEITITSDGVRTGGVDAPDSSGSEANPEHPMLEFSLEESNTAMALFGCDCPNHINQLRRLRGLPPLQDQMQVF